MSGQNDKECRDDDDSSHEQRGEVHYEHTVVISEKEQKSGHYTGRYDPINEEYSEDKIIFVLTEHQHDGDTHQN